MKDSVATMVRAMGRADAVLMADLRKLEEAVSSEKRPALSSRLKALGTHLAEHFRLEEKDGYMDVVRKRQPRLEREVQHLQDEHAALTGALDNLIREASASKGAEGGFQKKVQAWIDQMRQHEMRENALVEEAFTVDIGTKD